MSKEEWDALSDEEKEDAAAMLDFQAAEDRRKHPSDCDDERNAMQERFRAEIGRYAIPYTCKLCGQRIDDGKPCGCGARH